MPRLDSIDELRVFAQVVESGSIVAASRALGLHPSTASRRLAALEARVGRPLLHRSTRSQSLSETGRALLQQVHRLLEEAETAELLLDADATALTGMVKVGVPSVLSEDVLACVAPLLRRHPGLRVQVHVHDAPLNPLRAGLDVVLRGGALADSGLVARKLLDFEVVLAASRDYLATHGTPQTPADLSAHAVVRTPSGAASPTWTLLDPAGDSVLVPVAGQVHVDGGRARLDAIRLGLGIGGTSPRLIRRHPDLCRVLPGYRLGKFPIFAVFPSSGRRSAKLMAVVHALLEFLQDGGVLDRAERARPAGG